MKLFNRKLRYAAIRIPLIYCVFAVCWIMVSDQILELLLPEASSITHFQTIKGLLFILLTAALLYHLINRQQLLTSRYNSLTVHANDSILLLDHHGKVVDANDRALSMYGYTREAMQHIHARQLLPEGVQDWRTSFLAETQHTGIIFETEHKRANGTTLAVEVSACLLNIGGHEYIQVIVRDITERLRVLEKLRESEQLLADMSSIAHIGGWEFDVETGIGSWTKEVAHIHGVEFKDNISTEFGLGFYEAESRQKIEAAIQEAIEHGTPYDLELAIVTVRGIRKWVRTVCTPRIVDGRVIKLQGSFQDISDRKVAEDKMRLATLVFENSSEAIMVVDAESQILSVNPAFTEMTGYTAQDVVGKTPKILASGKQDRKFYEEMWHLLDSNGKWQGEVWNRRKNGESYAEWLTIDTIYNEHGEVIRRVALFSDITKNKQNQEVIWRQANFDQLTGLPNRRMLHDRLNQEILKADRHQQMLAVLFLDLDRFKEVNDTYGHLMGDQLLQESAHRLQHSVRECDTVARLGGDEFVVILSGLQDKDVVQDIAQSILKKFEAPFQLDNDLTHVSVSIGITIYPEDGSVGEVLFKNADQAMYVAKSNGRNRYSYFTASMQEHAQHRMRLSNDLHLALPGQQFELYYQPIVELATGQVHKAEALLRWQHPTRGMIPPDNFIPLAEETGLIVDIGNWVFYEAARQAKRLQSLHHPGFQISINKSPVQFHNEMHGHEAWIAFMAMNGLPRQSIVVEITEGLLMHTDDSISAQLLGFRDAGVQVALDDFGTGYSSLSYLKKFDIDYLKIDRMFVRNLSRHSSDMALCEAIVMMAHKLDMKVIAEGIETEEQRELLQQIGCDFGQGYLFSPPLPAPAFEAYLRP
ncbi:MAG TPA: EAL domain-containing protein [Methylovorus sp.]|nr:EAL domain-containing protein [Methylovorus sp.]